MTVSADGSLSERELVELSVPLLEKQWSSVVYTEVPIFSRCADAVAVKDEDVRAIEFKLRDWRRAVRQAKRHLVAVDYTYVCMPRPKTNRCLEAIVKECKSASVGLMFVVVDADEPGVEEILPAERSTIVWEPEKHAVRSFLYRTRSSSREADMGDKTD